MRLTRALLGVALATYLTSSIQAQGLYDDFESYTTGNVHQQGPWQDFGGTLPGEVSADRSISGNQSLKLTQNADNGLPDFPGYGSDVFMDLPAPMRSGQTEFSYSMYVPSDFDGTAHAFVSERSLGAGQFDFGMQLVADRIQGFQIYFDGVQAFGLPLITDQWVEVVADIDLDANAVSVTYGGEALFIGAWDPNPENALDRPTLSGVNLWVQDGIGSGSVYVDDLTIGTVPEPGSIVLLSFGVLGMLRFRKSSR